ncbi:MAG: DNA cytosine methyltransferase [Acidilobaceae archaeon]|nr:DNA cytosine methyltransferase [Acidilobaceae archaeon]MDW7974130.1 DNA cytosine methyltransferase [Sulfolobales archaeon]
MRREYTVVDLFSGGGGFSRGFEDAGFRTVVAIENYPPAAKTFKANFPNAVVIAEDIKEVSQREIKEVSGIGSEEVDVVIASPPCEPFTPANPDRLKDPLDRLYTDPQGVLFLHAIRLIGELRPRLFVIENVPGILEDSIRESITKELGRVGYERVYFNVLRAEDHGNPSERVRVFVSNAKITPPKSLGPSVEEVLGNMPPPGSHLLNHDYPAEVPRRHRNRLAKLKWGKALIRFRGAEGTLPNYVRLDPRRRAPTVMGSSRFVHPYEPRLLTVREQARLMSFPDHHIFLGSRDAQYNMVGEAVPPVLAMAIALYLRQLLE